MPSAVHIVKLKQTLVERMTGRLSSLEARSQTNSIFLCTTQALHEGLEEKGYGTQLWEARLTWAELKEESTSHRAMGSPIDRQDNARP